MLQLQLSHVLQITAGAAAAKLQLQVAIEMLQALCLLQVSDSIDE